MMKRNIEYMCEYIWEQSQQLNKKEKKKSTNIKQFFLDRTIDSFGQHRQERR
jgi:hypothetical protein